MNKRTSVRHSTDRLIISDPNTFEIARTVFGPLEPNQSKKDPDITYYTAKVAYIYPVQGSPEGRKAPLKFSVPPSRSNNGVKVNYEKKEDPVTRKKVVTTTVVGFSFAQPVQWSEEGLAFIEAMKRLYTALLKHVNNEWTNLVKNCLHLSKMHKPNLELDPESFMSIPWQGCDFPLFVQSVDQKVDRTQPAYAIGSVTPNDGDPRNFAPTLFVTPTTSINPATGKPIDFVHEWDDIRQLGIEGSATLKIRDWYVHSSGCRLRRDVTEIMVIEPFIKELSFDNVDGLEKERQRRKEFGVEDIRQRTESLKAQLVLESSAGPNKPLADIAPNDAPDKTTTTTTVQEEKPTLFPNYSQTTPHPKSFDSVVANTSYAQTTPFQQPAVFSQGNGFQQPYQPTFQPTPQNYQPPQQVYPPGPAYQPPQQAYQPPQQAYNYNITTQ